MEKRLREGLVKRTFNRDGEITTACNDTETEMGE